MITSPGDRAAAIFFALSTVEAEDRPRLLDEQCGGDHELRREVERLLAMLDLPESVLAPPAAGEASVGDGVSLSAGTVVGDFVVMRQIGAGGAGVVHLAHQRHPPRTVALKILRREFLASAVQRRFEIEAELLGTLQHPGIAHVYAAHPGDETTPPFIAMELVNGPPLTEYADSQGLALRDRVELVARVADAVQHAHQRGIIHRDLKPGNILVNEDGQPKVVDFGVARRLTQASPATIATEAGQLVGTVAYMSPEQVLAVPDAIDTRTDVHALGVILFRLLAGRLPFGHDDPPLPELARRIVQDDAPRLGTIDPALRGDLEIIVARALAKEKERRYGSATGLASDLRRYLAGQPIAASADSAWYVVRRQLGRYRLAFGLSAAALVAVSALAVYASVLRARAGEVNARLEDELTSSTIERARLLGLTGHYPAAEELAWRELFRRPDSRHAQWALWELYAREPNLWTRVAHEGGTIFVQFSPDGRLLATTGSVDGLIRLLDAVSGEVVRTLATNPPSGTRRGAFTRDGRTFVSGSDDGTLRVWDVESGELRREVPKAMPMLFDLAITPDGESAVTVAEGRVELWSLDTGSRSADLSGIVEPASTAAISPVAPVVLIGGDSGAIALVDLTRRTTIWQAKAHGSLVTGAAFTPDGRTVATGSLDGMVRLWDVTTGRQQREIRSDSGRIRNVAFDASGTVMAVSAQWRTLIWDLARPTDAPRVLGGAELMTHAHLSADARAVATCHGLSGMVRLWDLAADPREARWLQTGSVRALGVTPDSRSVISAGNRGAISVWEADRQEPALTIEPADGGNAGALDISRNGRWVATLGVGGGVWDLADGRRLADLPQAGRGRSVSFADDDRLIVTGELNGTLKTWAWSGGAATLIRETPSADGEILALAAQGSRVFAAHVEYAVKVIDARSGRETGRMHASSAPFSIAVSPDGRHLAVGTYLGAVDVFDVASGRQIDSVKGPTALTNGVDFSADGALLAIASRDGTTRIWDVTTRRSLAVVASRQVNAERVRFLPDGRRLAIGYASGDLELVDLQHYLRHVAGNAEYRLRVFREAGEVFPRADEVIAWSRQILNGKH